MPTGVLPALRKLAPGRRPYRFYHDGREVAAEQLPLQRGVRGEEVKDELYEVRYNGGDKHMLLMRSAPLRNTEGDIQGAVCAAADVTDQVRYETHLKLLLDELNHRVKNTLAIVQSIPNLTFKGAHPAARADLEERLLTLGAVHNLLTEQNWEGAGLDALVRTSLKPHVGGPRKRLSFAGTDIRLTPKSAVAVSMALHELGPNAAKYGALSTGQGSVTVRWTTDEGRFRLNWKESGGPAVPPPRRHGFGTLIIERRLPAQLHAHAQLH